VQLAPVPRKIRELIAQLQKAGFENRGGKGSHRNFRHVESGAKVTVSGKSGDDAKVYQEKDVSRAIEESKG
jgi:predicted RNA binding protein YcfA (HicA-like mRNA interferase family)